PSGSDQAAMGFRLFLLVTAALFLRPGDLFPELETWSVYLWLILACLTVSVPQVSRQLRSRSLKLQPVTLCVLGIWAAAALSQLAQVNLAAPLTAAWDFGKVVLYYLLLVGLVNSASRLLRFVTWVTVFITILAGLALLQHHGYLENPALAAHRERYQAEESEEAILIERLCGAGIFGNPNDLSRILV